MEKMIVLLIILNLVQGILFLYFRYKREKELTCLTEYLMKAQDSLKVPFPGDFGEGKAGILGSEIYKLVVQMRERADSSWKEKEYLEKMLSDISHQLKTPLTSAGIMADLLKKPDISSKERIRYAANIERQTERMTWLVKSLLTLSRLDADMIQLKKEKVNLRALIGEVIEPFELMAEVKEIEIVVNIHEDIVLECDRHWMAEAFSNIVKNSLEHTGHGGRIEICGEKNNFSTNIAIRDNGAGIDAEDLGHIFERFYKGKNSSDQSAGIGLALSKQLIMLQNGMVSAESEMGAGTCFHIKLYSDVRI